MFFEFLILFLLSIIFIYYIKKHALRWGLIDIPNDRSIHSDHIPRGAGIGFFLAVIIVLPLFHIDILYQYSWTFLAIFLVFIIGILDDFYNTSPNTKFIILIVSTIFLSLDDLMIDNIGTFFGIDIQLGWIALPFTVFAVTGFTNALNLIDGLDGLAASISIVILFAFFVVGYQNNDLFITVVALFFITTLLAFLLFNWYPATIFMGDSGSLTLGFVISVLAIKSLNYLPAISILFIAALPIFDTVIVMVRRRRNGVSMFSADRCHMHHIIRHFFMEDTKKTVFFFSILQMIYSMTGLQLNKDMEEGYLIILIILNIVLLYIFLSAMIKRQKRKC